MQIKLTTTYHSNPVGRVIIKKTKIKRCWQGCTESELGYTAGRNANQYKRYRKQMELPQNNKELT
jgi:hypothetical protein